MHVPGSSQTEGTTCITTVRHRTMNSVLLYQFTVIGCMYIMHAKTSATPNCTKLRLKCSKVLFKRFAAGSALL